jgi:hypothetical protein
MYGMEDTKQTVVDSVVMVQQMAGAPEEVAALDAEDREKIVVQLPSLIKQADEVQKTGDGQRLLDLAKDVHRLVEEIPALAELFPTSQVGKRLSITGADVDDIFVGKQAQEQAAQIYNSVAELDQAIKQEIRKLEQRSNNDDGQTSPSS